MDPNVSFSLLLVGGVSLLWLALLIFLCTLFYRRGVKKGGQHVATHLPDDIISLMFALRNQLSVAPPHKHMEVFTELFVKIYGLAARYGRVSKTTDGQPPKENLSHLRPDPNG